MNSTYNFDNIIDRENTNCYKYDFRVKLFGDPSVTPMWVADMDYKTPEFVVDALKKRLSHEILGYTYIPDSLYQSIIDWLDTNHQWKVNKEWISFTPGVVPAFNIALLAFTNPGDKVIIQPPVYHPFFYAVNDHNRQLVRNPLQLKNGRYCMDFDLLKSQIDEKVRMFILCSPHNPTGNVWKKDELKTLADICIKNNILIISDEIHADLVYIGNKHIPLASISPEIADNVITLMAASKTFNFAGLSTSYYIASNKKLFDQYKQAVAKLHIAECNIFGLVATEAAYRYGQKWHRELLNYLQGNINLAEKFINNELQPIELIHPEATFLLWVDFRKTGLEEKELKKILVEKAKVGLSEGTIFGEEGNGFQRINIGCPRHVLQQSLERIKLALQ
jgi:cysteine-S-conjugate beta-lyase